MRACYVAPRRTCHVTVTGPYWYEAKTIMLYADGMLYLLLNSRVSELKLEECLRVRIAR